ncbi:MAG TPA: ion channel [Bacillota bacterium]|nr:ion channel [Bacillota bacterium]
MARKKILAYNLITLFMLYFNIVITFALLYIFVESMNLGRLIDHYAPPHTVTFFEYLFHSIYFSAITLLAVGYGDITPFGLSKALAIVEAMIGYILPAALVIGYTVFPSHLIFKAWVKRQG